MARGWSAGFYIAGVAALGVGLLIGGIVAAATGSAGGIAVAAVIAGMGAATGGLGLWESRRFGERAKHLESTLSEQKLFALAEKKGGTLQVTDVARGLRVKSSEAEALLDGFVDEVRVSMQVTDDGEINYVFREVADTPGPQVRVAVGEEALVEETQQAEPGLRKRRND
jgi:hypothetical protein